MSVYTGTRPQGTPHCHGYPDFFVIPRIGPIISVAAAVGEVLAVHLLKVALVAAAATVSPVPLSVSPVIRRLGGTPAGRLIGNDADEPSSVPTRPPVVGSTIVICCGPVCLISTTPLALTPSTLPVTLSLSGPSGTAVSEAAPPSSL